ncbi:MAG TPA: glycoside hydrolase family 140 protein [Bacteroidales bacterium]
MKYKVIAFLSFLFFISTVFGQTSQVGKLKVSADGRFFTTEKGDPFFWLGDTGWLLFVKTNREEAEKYLEDRRQKGFNVIQVMVIHNVKGAVNVYGDSALVGNNIARPKVTPGSLFGDSVQYDFWDHVDYVVDKAAEKGIYLAMVPVWGGNVKSGWVSREQAKEYATFLAKRYRDKKNIIWVNGGDIKGSDSTATWNIIGNTLRANDPNHLITFHPFGRMQSSIWFHNEPWLDFNMFQSGHRSYDQDSTGFAEDNWRYVQTDYARKPVKPVLDGEPSYEKIPHGLHDTLQPYWTENDVRRYGYWSVFAGGCGFTYGDNAVMQFHKPTDKGSAYGAKNYWFQAINDPGAGEMIFLKKLMLSRPYFDRIPDSTLVADQGTHYNYLAATRGKNYAFVYTYNARKFKVNMGKIKGTKVKASWYSPRDGSLTKIGVFKNKGVAEFNPPGEKKDGNDWVLILDKM